MSKDDSRRRKDTGDAELKDPDTGSGAAPSGAKDGVSPDVGIRSMEERLEFLRTELAKWQASQARYPARADDMKRRITDLQAAIADTEARLAEYRGRRGGNI